MTKNGTLKDIETALIKAEKFDNVKNLHSDTARKLMQQAEHLMHLAQELDPLVKQSTRKPLGHLNEKAGKILEALRGGREFLIEQVQNEYDITYWEAANVMRGLVNDHGVSNRPDQFNARKGVYYIDKPTR